MKQFLPYLTDDQGRSLAVEDEVVVTRSMPDPLDNSPEGWENNTIQFARNNEFRGIIKSYTTSLKFFLHGAKIIRDAFYRLGMETVLFFIWLKQNRTFGAGMKYEGWYKGEPDFGTFKDDYDGVTVNITEGGFYKDLQANKNVMQEIPFDSDAVTLYMDGMNIYEKLNFTMTDGVSYVNVRYIPSFAFISNDGGSSGISYHAENFETVGGGAGDDETYVRTSDNYFFRNVSDTPITINIKGSIKTISHQNGTSPLSSSGLKIKTSKDNGFGGTVEYMLYSVTPVVDEENITDIDLDITVDPDEALFMFGTTSSVNDTLYNFEFLPDSNLVVSFVTRRPPTVQLAYRVIDLGKKLAAKISPGATMSSPLLDSDYNLLVTSGDAIRGFSNAVIKTNFSDYNKSVDAVKCIAIDIVNNNPVLSSRYDDFNKNSQIADLGECSKWSLDPAEEYIYDGAEVGYPAKSATGNVDVNGKYSFNNTFTWKLNITRRKVNMYQAKSVYLADPFDIELVRLNFGGKDTTSSNTDNACFFIDAEPKTDISFTGILQFYNSTSTIKITGAIAAIRDYLIPGAKFSVTGSVNNDGTYTVESTSYFLTHLSIVVTELVAADELGFGTVAAANLYKLRRLPYTSITGIPNDGTVFNIELSPRRIFNNHLRWLRSSFDHLDSNKLIFQTTEKNKDLETTDGSGNVISEKADIPVASMGEKVYLPYYVNFEIKSPENLLALMTANSRGKFDYSRNGVAMDGFPIEVKSNDATLETQIYKLLQTANNDNLLLINNR